MLPSFKKYHYAVGSLLLLTILSNQLGAQQLFDQDSVAVDSVHQFLWFHGHWNPSNRKQFLIENEGGEIDAHGSGEGSVTVWPDGSVKIKTGGIDEWNKKMDQSLEIIGDWENKLENASSADPASYDLNKILLVDLKEDRQEYNHYKIDSKAADVIRPDKEQQGMNNLAGVVSASCQAFRSKYEAIMAFWKAHKKDKDADLAVPPPPEFEYNCYACDSNLRKVYDTTIAHYTRDFFHPEDSLVRQGLEVIRLFELMGIGPAAQGTSSEFNPIVDLFHQDRKDASRSGPCAYLDLYRLNDAIRDIQFHAFRRACELIRRYRKDFRASDAIIKTSLEGIRNWVLFSGEDNAAPDALDELAGLVHLNIDFYLDKLKQHDWKQLGNIPLMYSLIRQKALLGGHEDDDVRELMQVVGNIFTSFRLSIDMDIKVGAEGGYQLCHLRGQAKIAPDYVPNEDQCFRWVVIEDQPKLVPFSLGQGSFNVKEPVKKMTQLIMVDLLANEIIAPSPLKPVYAGTRKYYTTLKALSMDFCNPSRDSILLTSFIPFPKAASGIWNVPHAPPVPWGISGLDHFFQDENRMQQVVESGEAKEQSAVMQQQAEELKAKMKTLASQMGSGRSKENLEKYMELQRMASKTRDLGNDDKVKPILAISFQLPVSNADVIVDRKYDAKEINPKAAEAIVYGYYTIRIEYKKDDNTAN